LRCCNVGITDGKVFLNYAVKMGSGAMISVSSFIKIGSGIQNLIGGDTQTHRQQGDLISLLLAFQNRESRQKNTKGSRKIVIKKGRNEDERRKLR
jgi:hypothetical protein